MFKDGVSDMAVEIWKLGNPTRESAESNDTESRLQDRKYWRYSYKENNPISQTLHAYLRCWIQGQIGTTDRVNLHLETAYCNLLLWSVRSLDTPWALISRGQTRYRHFHFCQYRLPIGSLWFICIRFRLYYQRCQRKNRWRSVDAHFGTQLGSSRKHIFLERRPVVWLLIIVVA